MNKTTNPIESLKLSELVVNPLYSGRDEKEIKANAKELAPALVGGWDPAQPGQYFIAEDGKRHLVAGFTRVEAAKLSGLKEGYFVKSEGDEVHHLTSCLRTNSGKPISRRAQGERYIALRDGLPDEEKNAKAIKDAKPGEEIPQFWKRQPMALEDIANLPGVGKTMEHIRQCILFAEDPVFAENEDRIAMNPFVAARNLVNKHHEGSDAKLQKIINAAHAAAKGEGKDRATQKHFDAVKDQFIPEKKLVADNGETPKATKQAQERTESTAIESESENKGKTAEAAPASETQTPELFTEGSKTHSKLKLALITLFLEPDNIGEVTLGDDEAEALADKVLALLKTAQEVF